MKTFCMVLSLVMHIASECFVDLNYYLNFHGEECARLNFNQSVHGWKYYPSKIMMICAPLLFFSPITSIQHLHTIFVDGIASKEKWNAFVNQLNSHLQDTNLLVCHCCFDFFYLLPLNSSCKTGYCTIECQCRVPGHPVSGRWRRELA